MIIAIPTINNKVFEHFGKTQTFTIFTIESHKVINKRTVDTSKSGHSALVDVLLHEKVNALICGGIGTGAENMVLGHDIALFKGIHGDVDRVIEQFMDGSIHPDANYRCAKDKDGHQHQHHDHEHHHHDHEHHCSNHDDPNHVCGHHHH